jgi:hypothetical protein
VIVRGFESHTFLQGESAVNELMEGLKILEKYDPDFDAAFEHDIMYASGFSPVKMQDLDVQYLNRYGWMWDEELESWYHF